MLYDYSKESSLYSSIFSIISVICILCVVVLIILGVRTYNQHDRTNHLIIISFVTIISLILSMFLSYQAFAVIKYNNTCASGNYETIIGSIEIVSVAQNDYRGEELYSIDFVVNGVEFKNLVNNFSADQKNLITAIDDNVEVRYAYIKGELMIYQIVTYIEE